MSHRTAAEGFRVLVCAPFGRDAETLASLLKSQGYQAEVSVDVPAVAKGIADDLGLVILTQEALQLGLEPVRQALGAQPAWSDIPFVVLASRQTGSSAAADQLRDQLDFSSNIITLERPLSATSIISATASALRARQRQFQMRDRLAELEIAQGVLKKAASDLDAQVQARTEDLQDALARLQAETQDRERAEASLRQSQKMEAVGQLTGGIAHDFNNMLTGIIGSLDLMRRRIATGRIDHLERYMDAASASATRAAALTQRLLAFSRRQSLDAKPADINALVEAMSDLIERAVDERVGLKFDLTSGLPSAVVDPHQLENAILNLALNARDAMPEGGTLTIETTVMDLDETYSKAKSGIDPGRYIVVAVSDTGVGMEPDLVAKVFDPFFTTKPLGQGTGLGLSMVYGFAQQSGGQVRIHSQVGIGTSVKLFLPTTQAAPAASEVHGKAPQVGRGQRVVVIEDDPAVRMLVLEVLEELRYQAVEFADPLAAVPFFASNEPIDLMISDVGLPGMNGRELAENVRSTRPDLPILFITGYAENAAIRADFLGANMQMITKPFSLDVLASKVSEMLSAKGRP